MNHHFSKKKIKLRNFFQNVLLYFRAHIRQTGHIVVMTKDGSNKIVNSITSSESLCYLGCFHVCDNVNKPNFIYCSPGYRTD